VQSNRSFTGELIPGSRHVSLETLGSDAHAVAKDAEIITYCGGPQCSQSTEAARKLTEPGYTNVRAYAEGLKGWKASGYQTEQLPRQTPAA
jgi:rhodanese-related sulfurtransferase